MIKKLIKSLLVCLCLICILTPEVNAQEAKSKVKDDIVKTALKMGVDPYVVLSIAKLESGFDHKKRNASGAIGVFQLMPRTAKILGINPYLAEENIKGGVLYYKQMYKIYGSMDLALAAYNAGPGNVKKYNGIPPFKETKAFVNNVKREYNAMKTTSIVEEYQNKKQADVVEAVFKDVTNVLPPVTGETQKVSEKI